MAKELTYKEGVRQFKHAAEDRSGWISDSSSWSDHFIVDEVLKTRASQIETLIASKQLLGHGTIQTIPCIELEELDKAQCPSEPPSGCYWLKSTCAIPKAIKIISVSNTTASENFPYVEWSKEKYRANSRIESSRKANRFTFRDTGEGLFLYVLNNRYLKKVSLSGIFEDPYCAATFCGDNKELFCNPLDTPLKTDRSLLDTIIKSIWSTLPAVRNTTGADLIGDDIDNTKGDIQPKI